MASAAAAALRCRAAACAASTPPVISEISSIVAVSAVSAAWSARTAPRGEGPARGLGAQQGHWACCQSDGKVTSTGDQSILHVAAPPVPPPPPGVAGRPLPAAARFCSLASSATKLPTPTQGLTAGQGGGVGSPALLPQGPGSGPVTCALHGLLRHHHLVERGAERRELLCHGCGSALLLPDPAPVTSGRCPGNACLVAGVDGSLPSAAKPCPACCQMHKWDCAKLSWAGWAHACAAAVDAEHSAGALQPLSTMTAL